LSKSENEGRDRGWKLKVEERIERKDEDEISDRETWLVEEVEVEGGKEE